jgi:hypothetical protein
MKGGGHMKAIRKAVAVTGTYQKDGEEKKRYQNCGLLFKREDDSLCLKLDALPLGDFDGWINFYPLERDGSHPGSEKKPEKKEDNFEDDIPF